MIEWLGTKNVKHWDFIPSHSQQYQVSRGNNHIFDYDSCAELSPIYPTFYMWDSIMQKAMPALL